MKYTTYVLKSIKDGKRYIGFTNNLTQRTKKHNRGGVASTKKRIPLKVIHAEQFETREEAEKSERFLKSGQGRKWLNNNGIK